MILVRLYKSHINDKNNLTLFQIKINGYFYYLQIPQNIHENVGYNPGRMTSTPVLWGLIYMVFHHRYTIIALIIH